MFVFEIMLKGLKEMEKEQKQKSLFLENREKLEAKFSEFGQNTAFYKKNQIAIQDLINTGNRIAELEKAAARYGAGIEEGSKYGKRQEAVSVAGQVAMGIAGIFAYPFSKAVRESYRDVAIRDDDSLKRKNTAVMKLSLALAEFEVEMKYFYESYNNLASALLGGNQKKAGESTAAYENAKKSLLKKGEKIMQLGEQHREELKNFSETFNLCRKFLVETGAALAGYGALKAWKIMPAAAKSAITTAGFTMALDAGKSQTTFKKWLNGEETLADFAKDFTIGYLEMEAGFLTLKAGKGLLGKYGDAISELGKKKFLKIPIGTATGFVAAAAIGEAEARELEYRLFFSGNAVENVLGMMAKEGEINETQMRKTLELCVKKDATAADVRKAFPAIDNETAEKIAGTIKEAWSDTIRLMRETSSGRKGEATRKFAGHMYNILFGIEFEKLPAKQQKMLLEGDSKTISKVTEEIRKKDSLQLQMVKQLVPAQELENYITRKQDGSEELTQQNLEALCELFNLPAKTGKDQLFKYISDEIIKAIKAGKHVNPAIAEALENSEDRNTALAIADAYEKIAGG